MSKQNRSAEQECLPVNLTVKVNNVNPAWISHIKVTAHSNNRYSKSSREVILGSVRL